MEAEAADADVLLAERRVAAAEAAEADHDAYHELYLSGSESNIDSDCEYRREERGKEHICTFDNSDSDF